MKFQNDCGILLPVFSLPSPFGMGDFGPSAQAWLQRLAGSNQSLWQVLPLGPTGYGDSPYQSPSAFALNPLFVSHEELAKEGLVSPEELSDLTVEPGDSIDYSSIIPGKLKLLRQAAQRFLQSGSLNRMMEFEDFCAREDHWLNAFAIFSCLKTFYGERPWWEWDAAHRDSRTPSVHAWSSEHIQSVRAAKAIQFFAHRQWQSLRQIARTNGIKIVGDMPIFVAHDSSDVWANPELFRLHADGSPEVVAGVPPDYFSATGQLWGNPLYAWDRHRLDGFSWWIARIRGMLDQFDVVRIDHFRGFAAFWEVPGGDKTAERGRWVEAPGHELFSKLREAFSPFDLPLIAEDLGVITPDVEKLRDDFNLPGIRILQFAFGTDPMKHTFIPEAYSPNCVAYSGTHDNDTVVGWFLSEAGKGSNRDEAAIEKERTAALEYFQSDGHRIHWDFIEALYGSPAGAVIIPVQDLLGLGTSARLNTPGSASGNWTWRLCDFSETDIALVDLARLTVTTHRGRTRNLATA
jgi:4-alpha-glucanotransferase